MAGEDLDIRALRHFVAVAEELHFGRAAARLYVAQQALSRDVRRLETRVGARLLDRTTRRVALTPEGARLLAGARDLVARHDALVHDVRGPGARFVVDVVGEHTTPAHVLSLARRDEGEYEFYSRFGDGPDGVAAGLASGRLDAGFARSPGPAAPSWLAHRPVRREPIGLLLPEGHTLAESGDVPVAALAGEVVCVRAGPQVTPEWEAAALGFLEFCGARPAVDHPYVRGTEELAHHVRAGEPPVLTLAGQPVPAGAVRRPLVRPVPVYPWSLLWRHDRRHPGLDVLLRAAAELGERHAWSQLPDHRWLPEPP